MRHSLKLTALAIGLAAAAPAPQDIDFAQAYAAPDITYTTTLASVSYNPTTVFSAALEQVTASTSASLDPSLTANEKRDAACATQAAGFGPVPSPDTASAFLAMKALSSSAAAAPVPSGYTQNFQSLQASSNAYGYLGYTTLKTYDSNLCSQKCNAITGCISFNIYFERDPSVNPGPGCSNPTSTTNIKCVFWGGPLSASTALNNGQYREQFQVAIAGSNGYTSNSVPQIAGYSAPVPLGNAAINAPYDQYGFNSFMGSTVFVGTFNAQLCADACTTKSKYAVAHPPSDGSPVQTCQFFNTYILYINDTSHIQGQYCAMYSESWPASYATNVGQYNGPDHFKISYSFAYSNATNPGSAQPLPAIYQAGRDIFNPINSAQAYCSSLLGYTTPLATTTSTTTFTPSGTATSVSTIVDTITSVITSVSVTTVSTTDSTTTSTETFDLFTKRAEPTNSAALASAASVNIALGGHLVASATNVKRGLPIPSVLTKYPASIVSAGCSLIAKPVTVTSTISTSTTATAPTSYSTTITSTTSDTTTMTTTTTTSTSTSSAVATALAETDAGCQAVPCGQVVTSGTGYQVMVECGQEKANPGGANQVGQQTFDCFQSCFNYADGISVSTSYQFQISTGLCTVWQDTVDGNYASYIANPDYYYGYYPE